MIDTIGIFKNRKPNPEKLLTYGFTVQGSRYTYTADILDGQFLLEITVDKDNPIGIKVIDTESKDEYVLVHTPHACGAFVGTVIQTCEDKLRIIAEKCFDIEIFKTTQAKQALHYIENTYQDNPEFLWEKFPEYAVFRRKDNNKWYAVILRVQRNKLGLEGQDLIEIIDLKADPSHIQSLIDSKKYFPGYHMNKKHWYTICLDGSVPIEELFSRIDLSYTLACNTKNGRI